MHAHRQRTCTTLLATKFQNFESQKSLETHSPSLFLVPPLSWERFTHVHGRLPAERFEDQQINPYPLKNIGLHYIGPFYTAEKSTTEKKLYLYRYLLNNAHNPPEYYRKPDKRKKIDKSL